jgi:hypothetical protein
MSENQGNRRGKVIGMWTHMGSISLSKILEVTCQKPRSISLEGRFKLKNGHRNRSVFMSNNEGKGMRKAIGNSLGVHLAKKPGCRAKNKPQGLWE